MLVHIPNTGPYALTNARIPVDLLADAALALSGKEFLDCSIHIRDGRIAGLAEPTSVPEDCAAVDMCQGFVLPRFIDGHTHLDKGHILPRSPNPDGTFLGARTTVATDREARWTAADVRARMDFALRCAFTHGTAAIRTHIDSLGKQTAISWPVFDEIRAQWKGRIELQGAALCPVDLAVDDEAQFKTIVATAAKYGGAIGGLTFMGERPGDKLDRALDRVIRAASAHGLDLDFHVDESSSADALTLEPIARAVTRNKFTGRITAGHCCSLALQSESDRARIIDRLGEAGITVVSLPMVNMYLQDREDGRTPRWRGVAPVHELAAAGVTTLIASDNTRDPFHAYGDLDMLEVFREATRILHLDHCGPGWAKMLGPATADALRFDARGRIDVGSRANLVLTGARTWWELNARPQSDRIVIVDGRAVDRALPDYRELDNLI